MNRDPAAASTASVVGLIDTPPEVLDEVTRRWRAMSAQERFDRVAELNESCERIAEAGVRLRYPAADEREVRLRVLALRLGRTLMIDVYGWDPDVEGW